MAKRVIDGFVLEKAVVLCPECHAPFATEMLVESRKLNSSDIIEADLHRVFSDPQIRAALLACCPSCKFCAWSSAFKPFKLKPELIRIESKIEPSKKYALAVKWAREKKVHSLDIAFIALNGLWCTRESAEPDNLWLELAIYEHEKGMAASPACPKDDGMTHLIMGELYRQHRNFDKAISEYDLAEQDETTSREILIHQRSLAKRGLFSVTALPLKIARLYFEVEDTPADGTALLDFQPPQEASNASAAELPALVPDSPSKDAIKSSTGSTQSDAETSKSAETANSAESDASPLLAAISSLFSEKGSLLSAYANLADEQAAAPPEENKPIDPSQVLSLSQELAKAAAEVIPATKAEAIAAAVITPAPITLAPITPAPITPAPTTPAPTTPVPTAPAPTTPEPTAPALKIVPQTSPQISAASYVASSGSNATSAAAATAAFSPTIKAVSAVRAVAAPAASSVAAPAMAPVAVPAAAAPVAVPAVAVPVTTPAVAAPVATPAVAAPVATPAVAIAIPSAAPVAIPSAAPIAIPSAAPVAIPVSTPAPAEVQAIVTREKRLSTSEIIPPLAVSPDPSYVPKAVPKPKPAPSKEPVKATQAAAPTAASKLPPNQVRAAATAAEKPAARNETPVPRSRASVITAPQASSVSLSVTAVAAPKPVSAETTAATQTESTSDSAAPARKPRTKRVKPAREDFHFARNAVASNVAPNRQGWINDYGNQTFAAPLVSSREEKVEPAQRPTEQTQRSESQQSVSIYDAPPSDAGAPLPGLAIDDPVKGKDYSDAINRVESYLSFSRRVYSRNWMKL